MDRDNPNLLFGGGGGDDFQMTRVVGVEQCDTVDLGWYLGFDCETWLELFIVCPGPCELIAPQVEDWRAPWIAYDECRKETE